MKSGYYFIMGLAAVTLLTSCKKEEESDTNILFLHHSTGAVIWNGGPASIWKKALGKINKNLADKLSRKAQLPLLFTKYNKENNKAYGIKEMEFPKASPYGWNNNPFDYYNIWVKNAGVEPFMEEPTLEILTQKYQVIIFKHCYPVCNIKPDEDSVNIDSYYQSVANYKAQYLSIREKLHSFPDTKFILFTGAAQVKATLSEDEAKRANEFFTWVVNEWDLPGDNIFLWNLYELETEGSLYLKNEFASSPNDSHPNKVFAGRVVNLLFNRIIDIVENNGNGTSISGEPL